MLDCSVVYVDPGIAEAGDGSTPATALVALPAPADLIADTVYLIRRAEMPLVWGEGITTVNVDKPNIYFIGMPKPGDWLWAATPPAARDAWGADTPDYADVKFGNAGLSVRFRHDSGNGGVHRIRFLVPNLTSVTSNSNYGFLCWTNANHTTSYYEQAYDKAVFMTDCDWRVEGVNLDDPECVELCPRTINSWLSFYHCKTVRVEGCRFVYPGQQDSTSYYNHTPLWFNYCQRASMTDCAFWIGAYGYNRAQRPLCYFDYVADVTFTDNRNHYVVPQTAAQEAYLRGWLYIGSGNHTRRVERLTSRIERFYAPQSLPNRLMLQGEVIRCHTAINYTGYDQTRNKPLARDADIDVDMTPCWESFDGDYNPDYLQGYSIVHLNADNNSNDLTTQFAEGYTRNIRVIVPRENGIGRANVPFALSLEYPNAQHQGKTLTGIVAKNYRGGALRLDGSTCGSYPGRSGLPPLELGDLEGGVWLRNCSLVTVDKLEVGRPDRFLHIDGSTAYFDRIVAPAERWSNHQVIQNANHSRLVINRINVPVLWPSGLTFWGRTGIIVNGDGGVEGRWKGRNAYFLGENWNTRRAGGAQSSLKLWGTSNVRLPLMVGFEGFKNFRATAPSPGRYLLRMYGAHKLFTTTNQSFLSRRVVVKAAVKAIVGTDTSNAPVLAARQLDSQTHGWWEPDPESTWLHDDGLTPVVCAIPVDLPDTPNAADRAIDIRLEYDWNDQQGYFYLDPLPVLEPLDAAPSQQAAMLNASNTEQTNTDNAPATIPTPTDPPTYVFVTSTDRYHHADCPFAATGVVLTPEQIRARVGIPCKHCNPPALDDTVGGEA